MGSSFKEALDAVKGVTKIATGNKSVQNMIKGQSSIYKKSREGVCQFPGVFSTGIAIERTQLIAKALEKNYATMLQVVYSMNSTAKVDEHNGLASFVQRFHQNQESDPDIVINAVKNGISVNESYCAEPWDDNAILETVVTEGATIGMSRLNTQQTKDVLASFREDILNNKFIPASPRRNSVGDWGGEVVTEADRSTTYDYEIDRTTGERIHKSTRVVTTERDPRPGDDSAAAKAAQDIIKSKFDMEKGKQDMERVKLDIAGAKREMHSITMPRMLTDNDIKKANELVATTLTIRVNIQDSTGSIVGSQDFLIGVKLIIHPCSSQEIISNLGKVSRGKFFKFLRWTNGEISFFKDLVLNLNEIKNDVVNKSRGASKWPLALKRRAMNNKLLRAFGKSGVMPNATFVVTREEVDFIDESMNVNIMDLSYLKRLMEEYCLLGFVVVDESAQLAQFYFDGASDFETVSFTGLERENASKSNDFKEMLKMINRY